MDSKALDAVAKPSVPRASIIWLTRAVKVVRPGLCLPVRLHLDCVRFAKEWHLGITLGVYMSGFEKWMVQGCTGNCGSRKSVKFIQVAFDDENNHAPLFSQKLKNDNSAICHLRG